MLSIFSKFFQKKPIVLCIHGFGRRRSTEYNNFKLWGEKNYNFITFDIFDDMDEQDTDSSVWMKRCEDKMEELLLLKRPIHIIGFSMGGVLATHLASKYDVEKLFLIAPAFEFLSIKKVYATVRNFISQKNTASLALSNNHIACFVKVIDTCKDDIHLVTCPTMIVHGDYDEVIPLKSSINAYDKIQHDKKRLLIIHKGQHRLMLNCESNNEVYQLFQLFMNNDLVTCLKPQALDPIGQKRKAEH